MPDKPDPPGLLEDQVAIVIGASRRDRCPTFLPFKIGSSAFAVLNNKGKAARTGLVRQRTPPQWMRDDFLADQHNG